MDVTDIDPCEVCARETARTIPPAFDGIHQICPRCGEFKMAGSAVSILRQKVGELRRALLSGWIREQNNSGVVPMITTYTLDNVFQRSLPPVSERATLLLKEAERGTDMLGDRFNINEPRFIAASYSRDGNEVTYLLNLLSEFGYAEAKALGGECEILPGGYMRLDEIRGSISGSSHGFIAMWFSQELRDVYEKGFEVGVFKAGYDPIRMDKVEHINRIDDEIIKQINGSKFVVADFTGHRGGVYIEAGYALGLGIPVFWTCRRSDMSKLHFDIRQFNCIDWVGAGRFIRKIGSSIGGGSGARSKEMTRH